MKAIKKLDAELNSGAKASRKAKAIMSAVHDALCEFCRQHAEFAQAVEQTDKTLTKCCEYCVKDVGSSVSDLEVYRRAAEFYFMGADVHFIMKIELPGDPMPEQDAAAPVHEPAKQNPSGMSLSLDDILGF